uniref:Major facilitator superfamily (MFS) profile domain-containing protein n=1 Tax=Panagrolaimus davidi TaxID=227884 RepID=A0A914QUF7_9BILA
MPFSRISYTAIQRWDIVCDKAVLRAVIQSMYYVGQMIGSIMFGFLGDRIGRKKVFFIALVVQFVSGLGMALSPHWSIYALSRLGVGIAHPGIFVIAVVIGVELIGPKYRQLSSVLASIFWSCGQIILGILAYNVRDYRFLHACIAFPALLFVSYWWLIPESSRWLVAHKRYKEADQVLRKASKINGTYLPPNWYEHLVNDDLINNRESKHHNFLDLIKTPVIRKRALASFFCWPVCSMLYYGISMNTNFLGGDLYLTFIFGGLSEFPALILTGVLVDRIGRKPVLIGGFITAAFAMLSSVVLDGEVYPAIGITQSLLAKSALALTYSTLYIFTPELFPTVIRNTAMGGCSTIARIGAITASYVSMWLVDSFGKMVMVIPFAGLAICASITVLLCLPETSGKELHETIEDVEKNE